MPSVRILVGLALACVIAGATVLFRAGPTGDGLADRAARDEIVRVPDSDPDMARAFADARADLPAFLALAAAPGPGMQGFAVKVGLPLGAASREFFWITGFRQEGTQVVGQLANAPRQTPGLRQGQEVRFAQSDIVDWTFLDPARGMRGNRTACVLLRREGPEQQREFQRRYGLDCDRNGL